MVHENQNDVLVSRADIPAIRGYGKQSMLRHQALTRPWPDTGFFDLFGYVPEAGVALQARLFVSIPPGER